MNEYAMKSKILGIIAKFLEELTNGKKPNDVELIDSIYSLMEKTEPVAEVPCSVGLSLREPDCGAGDCQYNHQLRCGARPFITVGSKGECLDYDVLTDEEDKLING